MSSARFDAFSELAVEEIGASRDDAEAVVAFLRDQGRGARIDPARVAARTGLSEEVVGELLGFASSDRAGLLDTVIVLACPTCGERHDRDSLAAEIAGEGFAECEGCGLRIEDLGALESAERLCLTEEAHAEAANARAKRRAMRVVLISALAIELTELRKQMAAGDSGLEDHTIAGGDRYYRGSFRGGYVDWEVFAGFGEATNPQAAATTVAAILELKPDIALFVGIAGGIQAKKAGGVVSGPKLGDVIAADVVHEYEIGKETKDGYKARPLQYRSSRPLTQVAGVLIGEREWPKRVIPVEAPPVEQVEPAAQLAPIAAGGKVVAEIDSETFRLIQSTADRAEAVEMEGSGFLVAIQHFANKVDGLLVRGISDLISDKGAADTEGWQPQAAANASAFAFELLHRYQPEAD